MKNKTTYLTYAALIAALYVILSLVSNMFGLASGAVQVRISEALTVMPVFTPAAVPGLFVGCIVSNILTGCAPWDIVLGSLATLIGAIGTYLLRKRKFLCTLPPVIANAIIIPLVLRFGYGLVFMWHDKDWSLPFYALTVGAGEVISICVLGTILLNVLNKYRNIIFKQDDLA